MTLGHILQTQHALESREQLYSMGRPRSQPTTTNNMNWLCHPNDFVTVLHRTCGRFRTRERMELNLDLPQCHLYYQRYECWMIRVYYHPYYCTSRFPGYYVCKIQRDVMWLVLPIRAAQVRVSPQQYDRASNDQRVFSLSHSTRWRLWQRETTSFFIFGGTNNRRVSLNTTNNPKH